MFDDYVQYDGLGLAELIAKRDVDPKEVLEAAKITCQRFKGFTARRLYGVHARGLSKNA